MKRILLLVLTVVFILSVIPTGLFSISATAETGVTEIAVSELQIIQMPDKTEYLAGEEFNIKGTTIRVQYTDGTFEDFTIDYELQATYTWRSDKLDRIGILETECTLQEGQQSVIVELFDENCEIPITVNPNSMESITINETADNTLVITVMNSDNTSYDMTVLDIYQPWAGGSITTNIGSFPARIINDEDSFSIEMEKPQTGEWIVSNALSNSIWYERFCRFYLATEIISNFSYFKNLDKYSGTISSSNIDHIVQMAVWMDDLFWEDDIVVAETENYRVFTCEPIRNALKKWFLTDVDLTCSENYDKQSDTYLMYYPGWGPLRKLSPSQINSNNGEWTVKAIWCDSALDNTEIINTEIIFNDNLQIIGFNPNATYVSGELNGDGKIDSLDGLLLMRYLNGWNVNVASPEAMDVNGDGKVNSLDGLILMRYLNGWNVTLG